MASGGWHGRVRQDLTPIQVYRKKIARQKVYDGAYASVVVALVDEHHYQEAVHQLQSEGRRFTSIRFTPGEEDADGVPSGMTMYHLNKRG